MAAKENLEQRLIEEKADIVEVEHALPELSALMKAAEAASAHENSADRRNAMIAALSPYQNLNKLDTAVSALIRPDQSGYLLDCLREAVIFLNPASFVLRELNVLLPPRFEDIYRPAPSAPADSDVTPSAPPGSDADFTPPPPTLDEIMKTEEAERTRVVAGGRAAGNPGGAQITHVNRVVAVTRSSASSANTTSINPYALLAQAPAAPTGDPVAHEENDGNDEEERQPATLAPST